jgi:hypothetical protein
MGEASGGVVAINTPAIFRIAADPRNFAAVGSKAVAA